MELGKEDEEVAEVDEQCYENTVFIGEGGGRGGYLCYTQMLYWDVQDCTLESFDGFSTLYVWHVLTRHYSIVDFRYVRTFRVAYTGNIWFVRPIDCNV